MSIKIFISEITDRRKQISKNILLHHLGTNVFIDVEISQDTN